MYIYIPGFAELLVSRTIVCIFRLAFCKLDAKPVLFSFVRRARRCVWCCVDLADLDLAKKSSHADMQHARF